MDKKEKEIQISFVNALKTLDQEKTKQEKADRMRKTIEEWFND